MDIYYSESSNFQHYHEPYEEKAIRDIKARSLEHSNFDSEDRFESSI